MKYRDQSGRWVEIPGPKGSPGFSPIITVKQSTSSIYKLEITTEDGTIITPNLRGAGGGLDAVIVDELPTGEDIDVGIIYLTLVKDAEYLPHMYRDGKWITFGGATTTIVDTVIADPKFKEKVVDIIDGEVGQIATTNIEKLFS